MTSNEIHALVKKHFTDGIVVTPVYQTSKYEMFVLHDVNRDTRESHINQLADDIRIKGLITPIVVNEKFEVIDGQHRLLACKKAGVPVKFIVEPGLTIDLVASLNIMQMKWKTEDYVHSGIQKNAVGFKELKHLHDEYGSPYRTTLYALTRISDVNQIKFHAESAKPFVFDTQDLMRAQRELGFVKQNSKNIISMGMGDPARIALAFAYTNVPDKNRLQHVLDTRARELGADARKAGKGTVESCLTAITEAYNFRLSTKKITSLADAYRESLSPVAISMINGKRAKRETRYEE